MGYLALRLALEHLVVGELPDDDRTVAGALDRPGRCRSRSGVERSGRRRSSSATGITCWRCWGRPAAPAPAAQDVAAQVVMCIDVRSEGMRRHLEQIGPYATVGFAGFFGLPVRVASLDHDPVPSCPVIVEPRATVVERIEGGPDLEHRHHDRHLAAEAAWDARHDAKSTPAAPFAFAEAAGWVLGPLAALRTFAPRAARRCPAGPPNVRSRLPTRMDVGAGGDGRHRPPSGSVPPSRSAWPTGR